MRPFDEEADHEVANIMKESHVLVSSLKYYRHLGTPNKDALKHARQRREQALALLSRMEELHKSLWGPVP